MTKIKKEAIINEACSYGAARVGFAPVERWEECDEVPEAYRPLSIWPWAKTVIVLLIPSLLPTLETKISHIYRDQYNITNSLLDEMAYRLAFWLNRRGWAALNVSRDGYGVGPVPRDPLASFSHTWAGYYAGLGNIGWNHVLLTRKEGPRNRLVSVITSLPVEGDPMIQEPLCTHCRLCERACPTKSFKPGKSKLYAEMTQDNCTYHRKGLPYSHCGFCCKVCPVGEDRVLYKSRNIGKYFKEVENLDSWDSGVGGKIKDWY
jgi:epoxyqueuosine reductase QueG